MSTVSRARLLPITREQQLNKKKAETQAGNEEQPRPEIFVRIAIEASARTKTNKSPVTKDALHLRLPALSLLQAPFLSRLLARASYQ